MSVTFKDLEEHAEQRKKSAAIFTDKSFAIKAFDSAYASVESYVNDWFEYQQEQFNINDGAEPINSALSSIIKMLAAEMTFVLAFQYNIYVDLSKNEEVIND